MILILRTDSGRFLHKSKYVNFLDQHFFSNSDCKRYCLYVCKEKKIKIFKFWVSKSTLKISWNGKCGKIFRILHFKSAILERTGNCVKSCDIVFWKYQFCDKVWNWYDGNYAKRAYINKWKVQLCGQSAKLRGLEFYLCCSTVICALTPAILKCLSRFNRVWIGLNFFLLFHTQPIRQSLILIKKFFEKVACGSRKTFFSLLNNYVHDVFRLLKKPAWSINGQN